MKYINAISIILGLAVISSCVKHEVIPKPDNSITLPVSFTGKINGANYEIIEDIDGFYCKPSQTKTIVSSPNSSSIVYQSELKTDQKQDKIEVRVGKLKFISSNNNTPSVEEFNEFFEDDLPEPITYKFGADDGVEIVYRDGFGTIWTTSETSGLPQNFEFTHLEKASDDDGSYMAFVAKFSASLYNNLMDEELSDTLEIQNATFEGYFKR